MLARASSPNVQPPSHIGSEKEPILRLRRRLDFADMSLDVPRELEHLGCRVESGQPLMEYLRPEGHLDAVRDWLAVLAPSQRVASQVVLMTVPQRGDLVPC